MTRCFNVDEPMLIILYLIIGVYSGVMLIINWVSIWYLIIYVLCILFLIILLMTNLNRWIHFGILTIITLMLIIVSIIIK